MELNEYQELASRTARTDRPFLQTVANFALGVAGEAGEVVDEVKKLIYHGHPLDKDKMKKELGDVLWYTSQLARAFGIELDDIAITNLEKLKARYPDGFSEERSLHRTV
ncbi:nucleoside triphosphate pyrophosphohydrolase family protein [Alicyclobacillus shizuokensis]|uniref:nucleoside triphosphate pyrophosphohydrolase family protein n=1 Tax=Alicyclobacillus shizuokensis TaxID=392014 RepID=UPI0008360F6B|nr:nucleoside triphosphate pyrophosphohydrolase family protein [Alicyclobacillus shizuokensis]